MRAGQLTVPSLVGSRVGLVSGREQGTGKSCRTPFPRTGDPRAPRGAGGASCPQHSGSHTGTVPNPVPRPCCCWVGFSLNIFPHPSRGVCRTGMGWGSAPHPAGKAIPCAYSRKARFGGKSHFPQRGAGPDARALAHSPAGCRGCHLSRHAGVTPCH